MSTKSLQDAVAGAGGAVEYLRNNPALPYQFPVKPEFSNWRSEQRAWRETASLLDQSHHMTDLFIRGSDALRVFAELGANNFSRFRPDVAKQLVLTNHEGYLVGDGILFFLAEDELDFVSPSSLVVDWVQYHAATGGYDVSIERDENSFARSGPPKLFRFEVQGPSAAKILETASGHTVPEVRFFHMTRFRIAGLEVRALRHGMAGQPGFELFGPYENGEAVRAAILEAGSEHGILPAGSRAYATANLESGWIPSPLPAIFSGEGMEAFRSWCPAEHAGALGGSFVSSNIEDFYVTPFDLGYGPIVAFDHEFPGREALQRLAERPSRQKVTLVWNRDDVANAMLSQLGPELSAKFMEWPKSRYALYQVDQVLDLDGTPIGISLDCGYIYNEKAFVSLAAVETEHAATGAEVQVLWGERPNSSKPAIEPHVQVALRATVAPAPYDAYARSTYRVSTHTDGATVDASA
ncbi:MAG: aminomethyl transferase family protein [Actinomycetota bacterium]|nr:aminomethyl transferase family protein [Actinomycetota bacterium]